MNEYDSPVAMGHPLCLHRRIDDRGMDEYRCFDCGGLFRYSQIWPEGKKDADEKAQEGTF